jgi:hypothetical protein
MGIVRSGEKGRSSSVCKEKYYTLSQIHKDQNVNHLKRDSFFTPDIRNASSWNKEPVLGQIKEASGK